MLIHIRSNSHLIRRMNEQYDELYLYYLKKGNRFLSKFPPTSALKDIDKGYEIRDKLKTYERAIGYLLLK